MIRGRKLTGGDEPASREGSARQSRARSLAEAVANVVEGVALAALAQLMVFPAFGLRAALAEMMNSAVAVRLRGFFATTLLWTGGPIR